MLCYRLLVCASDEEFNAAALWDGGMGGRLPSLHPHSTPPLAMRPFVAGQHPQQFVATLSEQQLFLHKLCIEL